VTRSFEVEIKSFRPDSEIFIVEQPNPLACYISYQCVDTASPQNTDIYTNYALGP